MAVSGVLSGVLVLTIMAALALPGLWLFVWGVWPRRRGEEPRCRKCAYNLTGLESERCPECGSDVKIVGGVVPGVRKRRPGLIVSGVLLLLLSAAPLIPAVKQVDWYRFRPTSWVIGDLDSTKPGVPSRAWNELKRRERGGAFSESDQRKLITRCLAEQGLPAGAGPRTELISYVAQALVDDRLTQAEVDQFVAQVAMLGLSARKRVVLGDSVPFWITGDERCPCVGKLWVRFDKVERVIDGESQSTGGGSSFCGVSSGRVLGGWVKCESPGMHTLALTLKVGLYRGKKRDRESADCFGTWEVTVQDGFEVLAEEPPGLVRRIEDPTLAETIRENTALDDVKYENGRLQMIVNTKSAPVTLAFDVWVRTPEAEQRLGRVTRAAGSGQHGFHVDRKVAPELIGDTATIILRGSADAAKQTVDLYKYWDGELVFKDVLVERAEDQ
jgi:hypothetical protein